MFVVNDRREYGHYVGQHGLVMENGLPSDATLSIAGAAAATSTTWSTTSRCRPVPTAGRLAVDVQLGPCDGRLYLVSARRSTACASKRRTAVERRTGRLPRAGRGRRRQAVRGDRARGSEVRDAEGRLAEFSGYYAAVDGRLELPLDIAANDPPGTWQISARELASGRVAAASSAS